MIAEEMMQGRKQPNRFPNTLIKRAGQIPVTNHSTPITPSPKKPTFASLFSIIELRVRFSGKHFPSFEQGSKAQFKKRFSS